MRWATCVLAVLSVLALSRHLSAQTSRGEVQGVVTDSSGAVVPNATVTLLNVNTGVSTVRKTSNAGIYIFELMLPGSYKVTVQAAGFPTFTQPEFAVEAGGDVTVNATLSLAALKQTVTVNAAAEALQLNTANNNLTIGATLAANTPKIDRNPFKLSLIQPQAVNTRGEVQPYNSWSANSLDLGGGTNLKNNLELDGAADGIGQKVSYVPNIDDVQNVIVSINSTEAQTGHSAGGAIDITTKSGTNKWHGMAFYLGRYPWLSAMSDRTRDVLNSTRQNMYGGTFGNPIIHNKLFSFFSIEHWNISSPGSLDVTVPTAAEKGGDFSHSLNINGGLRTIYDPFSTMVNGSTVTRTAFPRNIVPSSRFDPDATALMNEFWDANNPGTNITGENNYTASEPNLFSYYNFLERVDYDISDKWRLSGHWARYNTNNFGKNPTPNDSFLVQPTGSIRGGNQASANLVWTVNPTTVVDFVGGWHNFTDSYSAPDLGPDGYSKIWPNNKWYAPYQSSSNNVPVYEPHLNIGGDGLGGPTVYWLQRPQAESFSATYSHQMGAHLLKAGFQWRRAGGITYVNSHDTFNFPASLTASTFNNPPSTQGDEFATMLLGALDGNSEVYGGPAPTPFSTWYGMFIQDNWKVNSRLTITVGLRDEYETAFSDPNHLLSQGLDLSTPIPEFLGNPPQMPAQAVALLGSEYYHYTGAWSFTSAGHPGMWNPQKVSLAPRFGIAYRLNNTTAIRFGYARYVQPIELNFAHAPIPGFEDINILEPPFYGESANQNTLPLLDGVPQQTFSNPFPAATNPLIPILGKAGGAATGRGSTGGVLWYDPKSRQPYNDRLNLSVQHQFPEQLVVSGTAFANFGNEQYNRQLNAIDPRIGNQYGTAFLQQSIANPFYHYLNNPKLLPGNLYNSPRVQLQQMLTPYPQYGPLYEIGVLGASERYVSATIKAQERFSRGYSFVASYVYIRGWLQNYRNALDEFNNILTWQGNDQPRNHFNFAFVYQLPFGHGRAYLGHANRLLNALVGGWKLSGVSTFMSGDYPRFNNLQSGAFPVNAAVEIQGSPCVSNSTPQQYFNTAAVPLATNSSAIVPFNVQFSCLTGPSFWDVDASLMKEFNITERVHSQIKISAYNVFNRLNRGDPNLSPTDPNYGTDLFQGAPGGTYGAQIATPENVTGRQMEIGMRIFF
ncbi:MAG: carboxypeptidase regulatory-like domain-containing protein [Bryobacteraceae bacterium]